MRKRSLETHGFSGTKIYNLWCGIVRRCESPSHKDYAKYGAKGVPMCDSWRQSFMAFYDDMGDRPEGKTLDRLDNTKGYSKENCRWATHKEQRANQGKRAVRKENKLGIPGVRWRNGKNKFEVTLTTEGRQRYVGSTTDFFEACCLRKSAENEHQKGKLKNEISY